MSLVQSVSAQRGQLRLLLLWRKLRKHAAAVLHGVLAGDCCGGNSK